MGGKTSERKTQMVKCHLGSAKQESYAATISQPELQDHRNNKQDQRAERATPWVCWPCWPPRPTNTCNYVSLA